MSDESVVKTSYFYWLAAQVGETENKEESSYWALLSLLHEKPFRWVLARDENRALDGCGLREQFCTDVDMAPSLAEFLEGPCSILEMMVALSIRCENDVMRDYEFGDRTSQWFWSMVVTLGLGKMDDCNFDEDVVNDILERFMNREHSANGEGGLFRIEETGLDARKLEIWFQMNWYLNGLIGD